MHNIIQKWEAIIMKKEDIKKVVLTLAKATNWNPFMTKH